MNVIFTIILITSYIQPPAGGPSPFIKVFFITKTTKLLQCTGVRKWKWSCLLSAAEAVFEGTIFTSVLIATKHTLGAIQSFCTSIEVGVRILKVNCTSELWALSIFNIIQEMIDHMKCYQYHNTREIRKTNAHALT